MKMSLQLFEADTQYLLDFRSLPTSEADRLQFFDTDEDHFRDSSDFHTLEFFELCAMVIAELGRS